MTDSRAVVVGIDGSADAARALELAARVAVRWEADLHVVHAIGLTERLDGHTVPSHGHLDEISEHFDRWCEPLAAFDLGGWERHLDHGTPVDAVLRTASDVGADVVVVGRHGSGQRPERLLGSTAHQVAERATCPVLVVPPADRATE